MAVSSDMPSFDTGGFLFQKQISKIEPGITFYKRKIILYSNIVIFLLILMENGEKRMRKSEKLLVF